MALNHVYIAPFFSNSFSSLEDAKWNLEVGLTRSEVKKYLYVRNESIAHYVGGKLRSLTSIKVDDNGNISFGKTFRV